MDHPRTEESQPLPLVVRAEQGLGPLARLVVWAVLFQAILLVYAPALGAPFLYDDIPSIVENPEFRSERAAFLLFSSHPTSMRFDHRPVAGALTLANFKLSGLNVRHYRITNIVTHWLVAVLIGEFIIAFASRFALPYGRQFGISVSALWAVHPLNTVTTIFIAQRMESLMVLFYVLALYSVLRAGPGGGGRKWLALALVSVVGCLGSKEVGISVLPAIALLDRLCHFDSLRPMLAARWKFYVALSLVGCAFVGWWFTGIRIQELEGNVLSDPVLYVKSQFRVVLRYLMLVFWPDDLVLVPTPRFADTLASWAPQLAILVAIGVAVIQLGRGRPWLLFASSLFVLVLAPTSLLPIPQEPEAEWRMYLPSAAVIAVAVAAGLAACRRIRVGDGGVALLLVAGFCVLLLQARDRAGDYISARSIWSDNVAKQPQSFKAIVNLGLACLGEADVRCVEACAERLDAIGTHYGDLPSRAWASRLRGESAMLSEDFQAAEKHFRESLGLIHDGRTALALGRSLCAQGRHAEALELIDGAGLEREAGDFPSLALRAEALFGLGRREEAEKVLSDVRRTYSGIHAVKELESYLEERDKVHQGPGDQVREIDGAIDSSRGKGEVPAGEAPGGGN